MAIAESISKSSSRKIGVSGSESCALPVSSPRSRCMLSRDMRASTSSSSSEKPCSSLESLGCETRRLELSPNRCSGTSRAGRDELPRSSSVEASNNGWYGPVAIHNEAEEIRRRRRESHLSRLASRFDLDDHLDSTAVARWTGLYPLGRTRALPERNPRLHLRRPLRARPLHRSFTSSTAHGRSRRELIEKYPCTRS